jgi:hypothetical protein
MWFSATSASGRPCGCAGVLGADEKLAVEAEWRRVEKAFMLGYNVKCRPEYYRCADIPNELNLRRPRGGQQ